METRDEWYKPNLLYNIHYRPPKKPEPPRMIVETVQFNPSVCTCGEHGCQPRYRMEKRVLWTNKETYNAMQQPKVSDGERKNEYRQSQFEKRMTKRDIKIGSVIESEQIGLKEENVQEIHFMIKGDGNKSGSADNVRERMSGDVEVRGAYKANNAIGEKENIKVGGDHDNDDEKEEKKKEEFVFKNGVGYIDSKANICIDEKSSYTSKIKEINSNDKSDRDNSEGKNSEGGYGEKGIGKVSERAFNNDCNWGGKCSKEDQIYEDQATREGDGAVDRDGAFDNGEQCSENRILINKTNRTAESCGLESKDEGLEDVEIASVFGIMSIYCNSELHNWISFEGEDD